MEPMTTPARTLRDSRAVALLLALGTLAYTAWVLETVISTGLAPTRTYVSELAAQNQSHGGIFRTTDLIAGVLVWAAALWALLRLPLRGRWAAVGWTALVLFGTATAVDSRLPLSCTPTADPVCAERERTGLVPVTHTAHATSSGVAVCGVLVAMLSLTVAARRDTPRSPLGRLGPALVVLELAATVWTLAAIAALDTGSGDWSLGVAQRLQVGLIAIWLGVLALSVPGGTRGRRRGSAAQASRPPRTPSVKAGP
jgi:hypothetical protein